MKRPRSILFLYGPAQRQRQSGGHPMPQVPIRAIRQGRADGSKPPGLRFPVANDEVFIAWQHYEIRAWPNVLLCRHARALPWCMPELGSREVIDKPYARYYRAPPWLRACKRPHGVYRQFGLLN